MSEGWHPTVRTEGNVCVVKDDQGQEAHFPRYQHMPISSSNRTIRLLRIEPKRPPWPLSRHSEANECALAEFDLEQTDVVKLDVSDSPYVAMSYCWGEPIPDTPLFIITKGERTVLPITYTAWEAVQRTLPAVGRFGKLMWIDQICINQHDEEEKAQQVTLMGDIYRRCWHCMIWLGAAYPDTGAAISLLHALQGSFRPTERFPLDGEQVADLPHAQIRAQLASRVGQDIVPPATDPGWTEIARLLQKDWFKRLWTLQEAVLCHEGDATIRCGNHYIPAITLMRASMLLGSENSFAGIKHTDGRASLAQISILRGNVQNNRKTPLIYLLQYNALRDCADPRDRIFAMLGLRNEEGPDFAVEVDYKISAYELFIKVARKMIEVQKSLRKGGLAGLPSWVPDWTRERLTATFESLRPSDYYFSASNLRAHVDGIEPQKVLSVKGKAVDSVAEYIDADVPDEMTEDNRRMLLTNKILPLLHDALRLDAADADAARLAHVIIKTVTLDGYTRWKSLRDSNLPPDAWSELVCSEMLFTIVQGKTPTVELQHHINLEEWLQCLTRDAAHCANRRFALLKNNCLGLLPMLAEQDDLIAVLHGSSLPFVLRPANNGCYRMIGVCYVDGIMHGESVNWDVGDTFHIC